MPRSAAKFLAVILTALALVPVGAHLLEMPNKLGLSQADYMTVQSIYRGWALLGVVLVGAVLADLGLAVMVRRDRVSAALAASAGLLMAFTLAIFFALVFPGNRETDNWTLVPANWDVLRVRWEYGHAAEAVLTFVALCAVAAVAVRRHD